MKNGPVNVMSVDVEDYFQVSAFESTINRSEWSAIKPRVDRNTNHILDMFGQHDVKATFFMLGWVAERFPELVRRIVAEGHELASHGYHHVRVTSQSPEEFQADIRETKALLEDIGGVAVKGYRAASYSIGSSNLWALDKLAEEGYEYSSSIYSIRHDLYGMPEAPRFAWRVSGADLIELPVTTVRLVGNNYPCGGGGYFRLLPYSLSRWAMRRVNNKDNESCIFYFHPWEIDPDQPRPRGLPLKSRIRHYMNLKKMEKRLQFLLRDFRWGRMDDVFLGRGELPTWKP